MKIAFSVLTYRPSYIADENINIGIVFYDKERNNVYFELTTNWARIRKFDDEIDIDMFKLILKGLKSHAERNILKIGIENYIKRYNNELRFGQVYYKDIISIDEYILETKQIFMRYDFEKNNRPTGEKQLKYIKGLIKDNGIKYSTKSIKGNHNESVNYDIDKKNEVFNSTISILKSSGAKVMHKDEALSFIFKLNGNQVEFKNI